MGSPEACAFCEIVAGRAPAHEVLRDDTAVALLDRRPLFEGHTLLLPVEHHETLVDLPPEQIEPLFARAQALAGVMEDVLGAAGSFVALNNRISQSVPHLHVHVVPRTKGDGLRGFFWPRHPYDDDAHQRAVAERIRQALAASR